MNFTKTETGIEVLPLSYSLDLAPISLLAVTKGFRESNINQGLLCGRQNYPVYHMKGILHYA
jgi:hypothetical protein